MSHDELAQHFLAITLVYLQGDRPTQVWVVDRLAEVTELLTHAESNHPHNYILTPA
jgi:hypothetical protein